MLNTFPKIPLITLTLFDSLNFDYFDCVMEEFLSEQKKKLKTAKEEIIQVVLGNEACDLDSVISSIVLAYFIYKINQSNDLVVPVLNIKREDVPLRTEVIYFLNKFNIPLENFVCIDEINLQALKDENRLRLIIVDHNSLSEEQSRLQECITQIIDHHKVNDVDLVSRVALKKIEEVGSCCTLVAEEILLKMPSIMDSHIAILLYGTILLDTVCLKDSAKRVTEKDKDIASKLEKYLSKINKDEIFKELLNAKFDVSNLTPDQLLKKDTKYISFKSTNVAIASLPMLLEDIIHKEEFLSSLEQMSQTENLAFIVILGSEINEVTSLVKRQIAIFNKCLQSLAKVSSYLENLKNPSLDLQPLPSPNKFFKLFNQDNAALSRKFVLPALQLYLGSVHS